MILDVLFETPRWCCLSKTWRELLNTYVEHYVAVQKKEKMGPSMIVDATECSSACFTSFSLSLIFNWILLLLLWPNGSSDSASMVKEGSLVLGFESGWSQPSAGPLMR